jgi:hypothetical protein
LPTTQPCGAAGALSDRPAHTLRLAAALPARATRLEPKAGHFFGRRVAEIIGSVLRTA